MTQDPSNDPYFFGYGSLVNAATHDFADPHPARLAGWRRIWKHTDLRPVAFLTVVRAPGCHIDGMIAKVPGSDWAALDQREWAYDRVATGQAVSHGLEARVEISVYSVPPDRHSPVSAAHPLLMSYLDVVVQGYLRVFGEDGVARFFETTDGWETPVLNDRSQPRYPRHQQLSPDEREMVDHHLDRVSASVIQPDGTAA